MGGVFYLLTSERMMWLGRPQWAYDRTRSVRIDDLRIKHTTRHLTTTSLRTALMGLNEEGDHLVALVVLVCDCRNDSGTFFHQSGTLFGRHIPHLVPKYGTYSMWCGSVVRITTFADRDVWSEVGNARVVGMGFAGGFGRKVECPSHGTKIVVILDLSIGRSQNHPEVWRGRLGFPSHLPG